MGSRKYFVEVHGATADPWVRIEGRDTFTSLDLANRAFERRMVDFPGCAVTLRAQDEMSNMRFRPGLFGSSTV